MITLTEERKQHIINEEPDGLWLVLNEENPHDAPTAGDFPGGDPADTDSGGCE